MILDTIATLEIPDDQYSNALRTLVRLRVGLNALYCTVKRAEPAPSKNCNYTFLGNLPELELANQPLIECTFQYYSVAILNYVRLVNILRFKKDGTPLSKASEKKTLGEPIWNFRDKIGGHFVMAEYNARSESDTDTERNFSVMPQILLSNGRWRVGAFIYTETKGGKSTTVNLGDWSLTEKHEELNARYGFYPRQN